jgi:hypothetical protein
MTRFKVTKKSSNGQIVTVQVDSDKFKTVRGYLQHRREEIKEMMMFKAGDSITVDIVQPVGYQVVDKDNEIHPDMDASFCIYTLEDAEEMVSTNKRKWKLLPIYDGDVEEPTLMF